MSNDRYNQVLLRIEAEWPDFEIIYKDDSKLMKVIDLVLKVITLWNMKVFMTDFVTTLGVKVYVPDGWDGRDSTARAVTLRHESVHMRQKGNHWWGGIIFSLKYLFWPLPAVWARARRDYEQEAYAESLKAWADFDRIDLITSNSFRLHVIDQFMSANYFWTWPWRDSIEAWYDDVVREIIRSRTAN